MTARLTNLTRGERESLLWTLRGNRSKLVAQRIELTHRMLADAQTLEQIDRQLCEIDASEDFLTH
ncbi:hypothetical protein [Mycolicibacterium psychrotolerans]|uniref:Uncharacterized protein n=1 Tax=Mycolicibacterium psychrotolerans TaxID=216929 RepID=A0A7I7MHJ4_9MYCO|nr:hypothetical protein [Mycolicibacterium psychrotolerans]BBX70719.1 hypothetical protein MPSYJ_41800 [Mycolicibacterium psychrotolerans]